MPKSAAYSAAE